MNAIYVLFLATCVGAAIVPQEISSLISTIFLTIPKIIKGTDSRVGFGFNLGNHADFQVIYELGPQTNTKPIANSSVSISKRQVKERPIKSSPKDKIPNSDAGNFLSNWFQNMKLKQAEEQPFKPLPLPGESETSNPLKDINLPDLLVSVEQNGDDTIDDENVSKQPQPQTVSKDTLNQLKQLFGGKYTTQPPTTDRPRFIQK